MGTPGPEKPRFSKLFGYVLRLFSSGFAMCMRVAILGSWSAGEITNPFRMATTQIALIPMSPLGQPRPRMGKRCHYRTCPVCRACALRRRRRRGQTSPQTCCAVLMCFSIVVEAASWLVFRCLAEAARPSSSDYGSLATRASASLRSMALLHSCGILLCS